MGFTFLPEWDLRCWEKTLREYLKFEFDKVVFAHNRNPVEQRLAGGGKEDIQEEKLKDLTELLAAVGVTVTSEEKEFHWSYEGDHGPEHWYKEYPVGGKKRLYIYIILTI